MNFKKIAFAVYLGCLAPVTGFATMIYVPANPCACDNRPCDDVVILSRDFRKEGVVKKAEKPKKVEKKTEKKQEKPKKQTNMSWRRYASINLGLQIWSWQNDYSSDYRGTDLLFSEDKYSSESMFGGSVAVGTKLTDDLRAELELGVGTKFEDHDEVAAYSLSASYLMLNMYHDFRSGFYVGGGLGVARTKMSVDGLLFEGSVSASESTSNKFRAAATLGYGARINKNLFLDVQYRLAGFQAPSMTRLFWWDQYTGTYEEYTLTIKGGLLMENTISAGLRFVF